MALGESDRELEATQFLSSIFHSGVREQWADIIYRKITTGRQNAQNFPEFMSPQLEHKLYWGRDIDFFTSCPPCLQQSFILSKDLPKPWIHGLSIYMTLDKLLWTLSASVSSSLERGP